MASNPANKDDPSYAGNELFVQKKYDEALAAYSTAIEKFPDMAKLYSNRALTFLKLNRPFEALVDIESGLKIDPKDEKLNYRKCTALLEMRRFTEASQFLDEGLKSSGCVPNKYKDEFKKLFDDMNRLKTEFVEGHYDIMAMIEEAKNLILAKHADFYALNKFGIREIDGKGRGLVAKEKIELGELLIACEPFIYVPILEHGTAMRILMTEVLKKLSTRPDLAKQFYRLYAGPQLGHLANWIPGESELVDLERIEGIVRYNQFADWRALFDGTQYASRPQRGGVCLISSFINHTCIDFNCARYFVGKFMFIRATKAIEKGDELTISYLPSSLSYDDRQRVLGNFGLECHCRLCEIERRDSIDGNKRREEIEQFRQLVNYRIISSRAYRPNDIQALERMVEELGRYQPRLSLDYLAVRIREMLATRVMRTDRKASIPMWKELIEDLKLGGDFFEALHMAKTSLKSVMSHAGRQDEYDVLVRGIAKMFFGDERVADLELEE